MGYQVAKSIFSGVKENLERETVFYGEMYTKEEKIRVGKGLAKEVVEALIPLAVYALWKKNTGERLTVREIATLNLRDKFKQKEKFEAPDLAQAYFILRELEEDFSDSTSEYRRVSGFNSLSADKQWAAKEKVLKAQEDIFYHLSGVKRPREQVRPTRKLLGTITLYETITPQQSRARFLKAKRKERFFLETMKKNINPQALAQEIFWADFVTLEPWEKEIVKEKVKEGLILAIGSENLQRIIEKDKEDRFKGEIEAALESAGPNWKKLVQNIEILSERNFQNRKDFRNIRLPDDFRRYLGLTPEDLPDSDILNIGRAFLGEIKEMTAEEVIREIGPWGNWLQFNLFCHKVLSIKLGIS